MRWSNDEQQERTRHLRHSSTDAEQKLWSRLRSRRLNGAKFRRQHPVGPFIVDFFCSSALLIIELDGSGHAECEQQTYDQERTRYIEERGLKVLRFWNHQIFQEMELVLQCIADAVAERSPHPTRSGGPPLPRAG